MGRLALLLVGVLSAADLVWAADPKDPLARARALYNTGDYDAAIVAAEEARQQVGRADAADLIAARAFLERHRETSAGADLASARERLRRIHAERFSARERIELVVGLGQALYFDNAAGAAADMFASALDDPAALVGDARERILDWWASALDRDARQRTDVDRLSGYREIAERMRAELAGDPGSTSAAYWLAAAAWGHGDHHGAWDAAQAGWVRAPLAVDHGAALRTDLDRLVVSAIVPDRARALSQPADRVRAEWEAFKERWSWLAP